MTNKGKLKPIGDRKPDEMIKMKQFAKEISKRTGFTVSDITYVWRTGIDIIIEYMIQGKSMVLPKIGMFYPFIKPSREVMSMNGGIGEPKKMTMAARWVLKFRPGASVKANLLKHPPTEEEVDNLYED
jgi:nucleoid DNA-binding protein